MEDFSKMLNRDLDYFILVHNKGKQIKSESPKKGKLESTINREDNLIKILFDSKSTENFIKIIFQ